MATPSTPRTAGDIPGATTSPNPSRSAFPFPQQSSTSRYRSRRGSSSSVTSVGSIGGSMDTLSRRGSVVREAGHNAISSLLQAPIVRTGLLPHTQASVAGNGFKAPSSKDIPPVTLTNIPHVPPENFQAYLSRITPLFESFQRGRTESDSAQWLKRDGEIAGTDRPEEAFESRSGNQGLAIPSGTKFPATSNVLASAPQSPNDKPLVSRRRSSGGFRRGRNEPTPLSTVPNVYFDADFHLENPRTFDIVSERAEIVRPPPGTPQLEQKTVNGSALPPRKALATNAILQEKLSWYLDTVEVHLVNSIGTASSGFFAALGSLKELQTEAEQSIHKIQGLRGDLRKLDEDIALNGLAVAAKRRRRANVQTLSRALSQAQRVVENARAADEMVDEGKFDEAADQMDFIGDLVCGRAEGDSQSLIDLRPLKALQGLNTGLQELQYRIGTGFAARFTSTLMDDLRAHVTKVPSSDTLKRWSRQRGIPPTYMEIGEDLRTNLLLSLKGLQRAGHTAPATAAYREAVNKEIKALIRKHLPSSTDDDADSMISTSTRGGTKLSQQEKSTILARNLRALEAEDTEKLLVNIYTSVSEALRRVSAQTKVLLDITSGAQANELRTLPRIMDGKRPTAQVELSEALDMSSLLEQAVDTAQTQVGRILRVRNEQSMRLPQERFLRYFNLNRLFADECEGVSGQGGQALKVTINAQITGFVSALGTAETERIAGLLDSDDWNAIDFSPANETLLQRILTSMGSDPPEWTKSAKPIWEELGGDIDMSRSNGRPAELDTSNTLANGKLQTKPAYIDETRYILVKSATSLLASVDGFLALMANMPSVTPAISNSLLEVLRAFNSRSCQLILGAGATRSAGLKNITTKHLALASQALSFVIALVPYMRECVRRHLPSGQVNVLADFDKTKRLYHEHQTGIHDKLVEIMTSRSQAHVKTMSALSFDTITADENKSSQYMETLTKETLTLHRVLSRNLSEVDVGIIMRQIFTSYKEQWIKAFSEVKVATAEGEQRLIHDAECLAARLNRIEGFEDIGKEVIKVVSSKTRNEDTNEKKKAKKSEQTLDREVDGEQKEKESVEAEEKTEVTEKST